LKFRFYDDAKLLLSRYRSKGLQLIAMPVNEFSNTAPQASQCERAKLYEGILGQSTDDPFPVLDKGFANGDRAPPFWSWLLAQEPQRGGEAGPVRTSYEKFLIDSRGALVKRYGAFDDEWLDDVAKEVDRLLS